MRRGEVVRPRRGAGFSQGAAETRFVVIQRDHLIPLLPGVIVVVLDSRVDLFADHPAAVRVPAKEAGTKADQVALVTDLRTIQCDRLDRQPVGTLGVGTMAAIDAVLDMII